LTLAVVSLAGMRHATPHDADTAATILTEAFRTDPFMAYLWPDPERPNLPNPVAVRAFMETAFDAFIPHGHSYLIDDRAAALWSPPGIEADKAAVGEIFAEFGDPAIMETATANFAIMHDCHPDEPHFYLADIGATDAARGQGLGSALIERVLDVCDSDGFHAHLDATSRRSRSLYERHGFETVTELVFAPGVFLYPMTRPPRERSVGGATSR